MMRIFRKKTANTKRTVGSQFSDAAAAVSSDAETAPATFSNPFGLSQNDPLAPPGNESAVDALKRENGVPEENGAPGVHPASEEVMRPASQDPNPDECPDAMVEPAGLAEQAPRSESVTGMEEASSSGRLNPWEPMWSDAPHDGSNLGRDRPEASNPQIGSKPPQPEPPQSEAPRSEAPRSEAPQSEAPRSEPPQPDPREVREEFSAAGAEAVDRSVRAVSPAGSAEPFAPGSGRGQQTTPLIRDADQASSIWTDRDSKTKVEPLDDESQDARMNIGTPGVDLQSTEGQPERRAQAKPKSPPRSFDPEPDVPKFAPIDSVAAPRDPSSWGADQPLVETKLWEAFTPSRPKYSSRFFAGRRWALQRIISAVEQDQAHIVIFGPRGIGKTSLANVLAESASEVEYQVLRFPCGSNATFEEIFRGLLSGLSADHLDRATQAKFAGADNFAQLLPEGDFGPTDLTAVLGQIKLEHAILIIDEFDRVESPKLKNQLAEAIKNLSDASARVTFVVIGIAHSLDELIGMHPSIQRHLVGIHLPLMTTKELERVVWAGEEASGVRFEDATRDMIVSFSKGLPFYAQLLSLHAGRTALKRGSMLVQMTDLREALEMVLRESDPLARGSYEAATRDETDQHLLDVLFAAAVAPFDDYGTFTAASVAEMFVDGEGKKRTEAEILQTLDDLARQEKTRLIETWPTLTADTRYAFVLQTMRQYVLLRQAVRRGLM